MQTPQFLQSEFYQNTLQSWLIAIAIAVAVYGLLRVSIWAARTRLEVRARRTVTRVDDVVVAALKRTLSVALLILGVAVGSAALELPPRMHGWLGSIAMVAVLIQIGMWLSAAIVTWVGIERKVNIEENAAAVMSMKVMSIVARLLLWSFVVLMALSNLGVDVTALVAGLGIGGIAVALAAQAVLGDLFASVSIITDKPFLLGDFLKVGDHLGSVEDIGLRTTRIRSLSGEQLIFSNGDLLNSRIHNYGRMAERRVVFSIGVTYQTSRAGLEKIPGIIREAIESQDHTRFDRSHFQKFGDFALVFESVYYVLASDYTLYMDIQQAVNFTIHRRFEEEGIDMAYPTQTLFLARESAEVGAER